MLEPKDVTDLVDGDRQQLEEVKVGKTGVAATMMRPTGELPPFGRVKGYPLATEIRRSNVAPPRLSRSVRTTRGRKRPIAIYGTGEAKRGAWAGKRAVQVQVQRR